MDGAHLLYFVRDRWPWVSPMRRREFIALLGSSAAARPLAARAQQFGKMPRVGVLVSLSAPHPFTEAFRLGMHSTKRNAAAEARGVPETDQLGGKVIWENSLTFRPVQGRSGG